MNNRYEDTTGNHLKIYENGCEKKMTKNIISISVQYGNEPCMVDVNRLHNFLLQLPTEKYMQLYQLRKYKVERKRVITKTLLK